MVGEFLIKFKFFLKSLALFISFCYLYLEAGNDASTL